MDTYAYLILSLSMLAPSLYLFYKRKDMRNVVLRLGVISGVAGIIAEFFYFQDYWRPPTLFGVATIGIEDFIAGFAILALATTAYPVLFNIRFTDTKHPKRLGLFLLFIALGLLGMAVINLGLQINSIFVSSSIFLILTGAVFLLRKTWCARVYTPLSFSPYLYLLFIFPFSTSSLHTSGIITGC